MDSYPRLQDRIDLAQLKYSAQYFLGPRPVEKFDNWSTFNVRSNLWLTVHPNLSVIQVHDGRFTLTLLGYMLDPDNPDYSDSDILECLSVNSTSLDDMIENTFGLGGRWLLIADNGTDCRVYPDATGLKQLFYTDPQYSEERWCVAQPNLIKEVLDYRMDRNATEFITWFMEKDSEYWWPGTSSAFVELRALLPNHYMDLVSWKVHRFWPATPLRQSPYGEALEKIKTRLHKIMQCASNRFELAIGISSGLDSRILLAACRPVKDKIAFYTVKTDERSDIHPDIEIPCRLANKIGLKHEIIDQRDYLASSEFQEIFNYQVPFAHAKRLNGQEKNLEHYQRKKVAVTGNASEIGRCRIGGDDYRLDGKNQIERSGKAIASLITLENHPFAVTALDQWISELKEYCNYNVLDILHWEQKVGRWFANNCTEYDISWKNYFTPYSNRNLLIDFLSVDERYRMQPDNKLYYDLARSLWPEVLSEPINPHKQKRKGLRKRIKSFFKI